MRFFVDLLLNYFFFCKMEVFPKQKCQCLRNENKIVFKTKMFLFRKHLQSESVFETKVKCF